MPRLDVPLDRIAELTAEGWGRKRIAKLLNISCDTVEARQKEMGIKRFSPPGVSRLMETRHCDLCGGAFVCRHDYSRRTCSKLCQKRSFMNKRAIALSPIWPIQESWPSWARFDQPGMVVADTDRRPWHRIATWAPSRPASKDMTVRTVR